MIAYRYFENRLEVMGETIDSTFQLFSIEGEVWRMDNVFLYNPKSKITHDTLSLRRNGNNLGEFVFQIENLKDPKVFLGELRDSVVSKQFLLSNPVLILTHEPQLAKPCSIIIAFSASIVKANNDEIDLMDESFTKWVGWSDKRIERYWKRKGALSFGRSKFSKNQLKKIRRMRVGDVLWIKTATLSCPSCIARKISVDLKLRLIE